MKIQAKFKESVEVNELSQEVLQILEILDQIENHTAELRKKLMAELKKNNQSKDQLE